MMRPASGFKRARENDTFPHGVPQAVSPSDWPLESRLRQNHSTTSNFGVAKGKLDDGASDEELMLDDMNIRKTTDIKFQYEERRRSADTSSAEEKRTF